MPDHLPISGVILADHVRSLDWQIRRAEFIARLPDSTLRRVMEKLHTLLPLSSND